MIRAVVKRRRRRAAREVDSTVDPSSELGGSALTVGGLVESNIGASASGDEPTFALETRGYGSVRTPEGPVTGVEALPPRTDDSLEHDEHGEPPG